VSRWTRTARVAGAAALGVAVVLAAGCSAGKAAQTANERSSVEGGSGNVGPLALRDVLVAYPATGRYQAGQSAPLELDVASSSLTDDTLVSIHTPAAASVQVTAQPQPVVPPAPTGAPLPTAGATGTATTTGTPTTGTPTTGTATGTGSASGTAEPVPASQQITVPAGGLVSFGRGTGPQAVLMDLTEPLQPGQNVLVTFTFAKAGSVTVVVPVSASDSALPPPSPIVSDTGQP
jgi:copper(I)-binding protein